MWDQVCLFHFTKIMCQELESCYLLLSNNHHDRGGTLELMKPPRRLKQPEQLPPYLFDNFE